MSVLGAWSRLPPAGAGICACSAVGLAARQSAAALRNQLRPDPLGLSFCPFVKPIVFNLYAMGLQIHFVVDPQGWCCMGIIIFVWLYNTVFIPKVILFPHYEEGHISAVAILCYYLCSLFCIVSLLRSSVADPGKLLENPKIPLTEREFWELCNKCNMMRPKRSHHCSRCGHCVRRMDHHCPWINNCVGEDNHWLFLQLCFYTQLLSSYTLILDFCHYYYFLPLKKTNWSWSAASFLLHLDVTS
ncbi:palmitoyltransferase ZDHHC21 isoform B [Alligator mississippiensis]|uniref:Palmitoyltransferase n=1 Tax=Alligator mississippiensis TaxID=8496 RepID=A0A151P176_ALLMI|nr:palmitoyltransferase ZDHHC21 isoform B [Alligator mississippiensis]